MALQTGLPVVPVWIYVDGRLHVWPGRHRTPVVVRVGEPIAVTPAMTVAEVMDRLDAALDTMAGDDEGPDDSWRAAGSLYPVNIENFFANAGQAVVEREVLAGLLARHVWVRVLAAGAPAAQERMTSVPGPHLESARNRGDRRPRRWPTPTHRLEGHRLPGPPLAAARRGVAMARRRPAPGSGANHPVRPQPAPGPLRAGPVGRAVAGMVRYATRPGCRSERLHGRTGPGCRRGWPARRAGSSPRWS